MLGRAEQGADIVGRIPAAQERPLEPADAARGHGDLLALVRAALAELHQRLERRLDLRLFVADQEQVEAGVQAHIVRCADTATGTAFICVSDDAENAITVAPGANARLAPHHLPPLDGYSHLLMQLETPLPTVIAYARAARAAGVRVVLNAAPAQALDDELLALVDILIVNEGELTSIAGAGGRVRDALDRLRVPLVVVTLGARGCCARQAQQFLLQPGFSIEPVDTTGAGDTFAGVLAAFLDAGADLQTAMAKAAIAGSLACTKHGAQPSFPTREEIDTAAG